MVFYFFSENHFFNLHFIKDYLDCLSCSRYILGERQINSHRLREEGQTCIRNDKRIQVTQGRNDLRQVGLEQGSFFHFHPLSYSDLCARRGSRQIIVCPSRTDGVDAQYPREVC